MDRKIRGWVWRVNLKIWHWSNFQCRQDLGAAGEVGHLHRIEVTFVEAKEIRNLEILVIG